MTTSSSSTGAATPIASENWTWHAGRWTCVRTRRPWKRSTGRSRPSRRSATASCLKSGRKFVTGRSIKPPTRDGDPNRKMLVFTTFKDTAQYLFEHLTDLAGELGLNMAMVSGDETRTHAGANNFNAILSNFAPVARNRKEEDAAADIDLLIATDCISEGQNLQDCDTVLNYDIHWNPVRLIQRFGRIDRIGSRSTSVRMLNYWPTAEMDVYLKLENRVQARMALADIAASGDDDPFTEEDAPAGVELPRRAAAPTA